MNRMLLVLKRSTDQEAALRQLLEDQLTLNSPRRHAWLTPAAIRRAIRALRSRHPSHRQLAQLQGLSTTSKLALVAPPSNFQETPVRFATRFHTEIHSYMVKGEVHSANATDPQIPAALSPGRRRHRLAA